jgi:putative aminopeptidase FrvX
MSFLLWTLGHEEKVADYTLNYLKTIGFTVKKDAKGNAIGFLPGMENPSFSQRIWIEFHLEKDIRQ